MAFKTYKKQSFEEQTIINLKFAINYDVNHLNTLLHHLYTNVNDYQVLSDSIELIDAFINNLNTIIFTPHETDYKEDTH